VIFILVLRNCNVRLAGVSLAIIPGVSNLHLGLQFSPGTEIPRPDNQPGLSVCFPFQSATHPLSEQLPENQPGFFQIRSQTLLRSPYSEPPPLFLTYIKKNKTENSLFVFIVKIGFNLHRITQVVALRSSVFRTPLYFDFDRFP